MTSLDELLAYRNPAVIRRFQREHPAYAEHAERIFEDLLRFFWASQAHDRERRANPGSPALDFVFIMDEEMRAIDLMWHVFLLYSQDYMDFCAHYFGEYLHHRPDIVPTLETGTFDPAENLERFLEFAVERIGEAPIRRWFAATLAEASAG